MKRLPRVLLFLTLLLVVALSVPRAWAAKEVLFYSSITTAGQRALVKGIEGAFSGLKVNWVRAGGVGMYHRFVTERMAGKGKIDILHFSYVPGWFHLQSQGWVIPGVADLGGAKKFPDWAKNRKAHFVALRTPTLQVVYNPDKVKPHEVPKSWKEFITPKWKNRLAMNDPFDSAGVWDFFYGSKDFGEKYIIEILKNRPLIQRGMGSATERVSTGERDVTFIFEYIGLGRMRKGANIKFAPPMKEGVPIIPAPFGLIKGGPNPEIAKKVFDFMVSKKGQMVMSQKVLTYSGRADVPPPPGLKPLSELKLLHSDWGKVFREQDRYRALLGKHRARRKK
jgi:iron(III) transport system substrate-binding protein